MPETDAVPRGVAVPETPSDRDREEHELTHLPRSRGAACAFEPKVLTNVISEGQQVNVQRPKDNMPVIQFDLCLFQSMRKGSK